MFVTSEAYVVLLLHREVNDHFAGLSARLSREEHLVLFSLQPQLEPRSDGLQPSSDGLQVRDCSDI